MTVRLWIDVEDLFEYRRTNYRRPSGIQRVTFEICRELQVRHGDTGRARFIRHSLTSNGFQDVTWAEIAALFDGLTSDPSPAPPRRSEGPVFTGLPRRQSARRLAYRLPPELRVPLVGALVTQGQALRAWVRLARAVGQAARALPRRLTRNGQGARPGLSPVAVGEGYASLAAPGDIVLMLGATWSHADYASLIRRQCKARGLRFGLLLHDLIPLRRPEWCDRVVVAAFRKWIDNVLPLCDAVFAVSRSTAADAEAHAAAQGISLPGRVVPLPVGSELRAPAGAHTARLPPPGSYALIVSTIEARKNHLLLFRVWRRMLEEKPREAVPTLVFAGRVGWLVSDLMQQIANTGNLGGKLVIIDSPSDSELAALYRGCLLTLFPSFYEGWGLPVTESLSFGKPCVIANRTSLPEAGGGLVRSFDPDNLHDAYAVIRDALEDRAGLAEWQERIRREFKPVTWAATVDALLAALGEPVGLPAAAQAERAPAGVMQGTG